MKRGLTNTVSCRRNTTRLATISRRTQGVMPNVRCGPISPRRLGAWYLSPVRAPRVPGQPADALAQVRKLHPRGPRGLREEARARHAGERVRLRTQPEVDPGVSPQFERPVRRERQLLELARQRRVERRREHLLRHARCVLALVV